MTIDPELQQMLRDASMARASRPWPARAWHGLAERLNVWRSLAAPDPERPRGTTQRLAMADDMRHALRRLRARPGTAVTAALMLALAIGVTSAMFTVADHMLITPVALKQADRLKAVWIGKALRNSSPYLSTEQARALRGSGAFSDAHYFVQASGYIDGARGVANKGVYWVSPGAFEMLGVRPLMGRTFHAGEGRPGDDSAVILSERVWRSDFGSDPAILGRSIRFNGLGAVVVGVMPAAFRFPSEQTSIWRPYDIDQPSPLVGPSPLFVYGRLREGLAETDAAALAAAATRAFSKTPDEHGVVLRGVADGFLDDYSKTAIRVLLAGVSLVFLVLCANVANLILARTAARRAEFGVCSALGASRRRLISQVFIENVVIAGAGLAAGLLLAAALIAMSRSLLPEAFLLRTLNPIAIDARAVAAAATLALAATMLAGLPPAWLGTRLDPASSMRLESRGGSESASSRAFSKILLIAEVALAASLLAGAAVLTATFVRLMRADPGLDVRNVTTLTVSLPSFAFKDRPARIAFTNALQDQLKALPGVTSTALSFGLPPAGGAFSWGTILADGVDVTGSKETIVYSSDVSDDFFNVYGIRLVQGRAFGATDDESAVVVSEGLARLLWPGRSPLGHTFAINNVTQTVIGVAAEVRSSLSDPREDLPEFYRKLAGPFRSLAMFGLKCAGPCPAEPEIRERVRAVSANAVVQKVTRLDQAYLEQFARPRAAAGLAMAFSAIAVLAAGGGLFSILSYAVSRRRREFGIRAAMGAEPSRLRRSVIRDGLATSLVGLAIGAGGTALASKMLESLAFGISAWNPIVWAGVGSLIAMASVAASWRPATQAMKSDPVSLLREN